MSCGIPLFPKGRWFSCDEILRMGFPCTALVWLIAPSAYGQWDGNWASWVLSSQLSFLLQTRVTSSGCLKSSCAREITQICISVKLLGRDPRCLGGRDARGSMLWMISPPIPWLAQSRHHHIPRVCWNETQFHTCPLVLKMPFLSPRPCCAYRQMCTSNSLPVLELSPAVPLG